MAEYLEIVFDSQHPARLARFWAAALPGYAVRSYDDAELACSIWGPRCVPSTPGIRCCSIRRATAFVW